VAQLVDLKTMHDQRGSLTVLEKILPFSIKRVFFIHNVSAPRGGHGHRKTQMAFVCVSGSCRILVQTPERNFEFQLTKPSQCLVLEPTDWHLMDQFTEHATLVVMASEDYDENDYVREPYR
jgi:dTDP-4-dehydrorhamnose 3,5-epimerase-like enzyme